MKKAAKASPPLKQSRRQAGVPTTSAQDEDAAALDKDICNDLKLQLRVEEAGEGHIKIKAPISTREMADNGIVMLMELVRQAILKCRNTRQRIDFCNAAGVKYRINLEFYHGVRGQRVKYDNIACAPCFVLDETTGQTQDNVHCSLYAAMQFPKSNEGLDQMVAAYRKARKAVEDRQRLQRRKLANSASSAQAQTESAATPAYHVAATANGAAWHSQTDSAAASAATAGPAMAPTASADAAPPELCFGHEASKEVHWRPPRTARGYKYEYHVPGLPRNPKDQKACDRAVHTKQKEHQDAAPAASASAADAAPAASASAAIPSPAAAPAPGAIPGPGAAPTQAAARTADVAPATLAGLACSSHQAAGASNAAAAGHKRSAEEAGLPQAPESGKPGAGFLSAIARERDDVWAVVAAQAGEGQVQRLLQQVVERLLPRLVQPEVERLLPRLVQQQQERLQQEVERLQQQVEQLQQQVEREQARVQGAAHQTEEGLRALVQQQVQTVLPALLEGAAVQAQLKAVMLLQDVADHFEDAAHKIQSLADQPLSSAQKIVALRLEVARLSRHPFLLLIGHPAQARHLGNQQDLAASYQHINHINHINLLEALEQAVGPNADMNMPDPLDKSDEKLADELATSEEALSGYRALLQLEQDRQKASADSLAPLQSRCQELTGSIAQLEHTLKRRKQLAAALDQLLQGNSINIAVQALRALAHTYRSIWPPGMVHALSVLATIDHAALQQFDAEMQVPEGAAGEEANA